MAFQLDTLAVATDGFIVRGTIVIGGHINTVVAKSAPKIKATVKSPAGKIQVTVKKYDV